jgi:pimeloyl-ACP methyl ester carboxylesterase
MDWNARGEKVRILGHDVFVVTAGPGRDEGLDPLLLLHGFPSSSRDFAQALDRLAARRRVIVHDHLGFGFSDKPARYSYSLIEQAEVAIAVWRALGVRRGHLIAHDYGTSVATELLARRARDLCPVGFSSLTLTNGSVHIELSHLTPSQRVLRSKRLGPLFARLASERVFKLQMRRILGDPASVSEAELHAMWEGILHGGGQARLPAIAGYMDERVRFHARWVGALEALDLPAHMLWGRRDPVAVPAIAELLARETPGAKLTWLDDLGHYPMLEAPARWADAALGFLDALPPKTD